jgi:erythromycin esterase
VIGSGLGASADNGISQPEAGTLEVRLTATSGSTRFIPTHMGNAFPDAASLPTRSGSTKNFSYFPLTPRSLSEFDWLVVLNSTAYWRGWPPLPQPDTNDQQ